MADLFISYSRRDAAFVTAFAGELAERGKTPWLDVEGIQDAEVFPAVLREAIERADGFVFVISPESARSRFCRQEVEHAQSLGKRIVPVLHEATPDDALPQAVRERQWIPAGPDAADRVVRVLAQDPEHTRQHTRLLLRARAWEDRGHLDALAPRGEELADAEAWLTRAPGRDPAPTALHAAWVAAGRAAAAARQRRVTVGAAAFGAVAVALLVFALVSRDQAVDSRAEADSRALAARSEAQLSFDPQLSVLLAREALRSASTPEAMLAAQRAVDASTLRSELPSLGLQGCFDGSQLALLDGGRTAAVTTCDGLLVLQDIERRKVIRRIRVGEVAGGLAAHPRRAEIAVGAGKSIAFVDLRRGKVVRRVKAPARVGFLAYDRGANRLAVSFTEGVGVLDLRSGHPLRVLDRDPELDWAGVSWAGSQVLAATRVLATIVGTGLYAYDLRRAGRRRALLQSTSEASRRRATSAVAVARDQRTLFIATTDGAPDEAFHGSVVRMDLETGKEVWRTEGPRAGTGTAIALSEDESTVTVGFGTGSSFVLDATTGAVGIRHPGQNVAVRGVAFRPGRAPIVTSSSDGVVRTWSAAGTERISRTIPPGVGTLMLPSKDDRIMLTGIAGSGVRGASLDPRTGRISGSGPLLRQGVAYGFAPDFSRVSVLAAAPDGRTRYEIQNLRTGKVERVVRSSREGTVGLSADGRIAEFTQDQGALEASGVILSASGRRKVTLASFPVRCTLQGASFSDDGRRLVSTEACGRITVHDTGTGRVVRQFRVPDRLHAVGFMKDGRAYSQGVAGALVVVDPDSGSVRVLRDHDEAILDYHDSADGRWLAAMGEDRRVSIWDQQTLRLVRQFHFESDLSNVVFSAGSSRIAVSDKLNRVRIWDVCDVCQDPQALLKKLDGLALRRLTVQERSTFGVRSS